MKREEFKERYVNYMIAQSKVSRNEAEANFEAGTYDQRDLDLADPEGAAADEISCWDC